MKYILFSILIFLLYKSIFSPPAVNAGQKTDANNKKVKGNTNNDYIDYEEIE
ncbi:MAG: hypothetical protein IPM42_10490 [Saprospiraceae bacterium]|nr:hypothetical protein [Saprospiraceae bacterium]